ncbi:MAG: NAD-dependent deacylase [Bacteroidetes bacterium]|jgi:NAD-dependent deacetylase|nr:NAD-dependent deacylase [Bacteroidota bacterium]
MSKLRKIVVFTGAGISAESGISTFRDSGGLWEKYDIRDVATPEAWQRNPNLVLEFYNQRRKQVLEVLPNAAHSALVELEKKFQVQIITQNVDDLHERAGSKNVVHLHGEIRKSRSTRNPELVYNIKGWELKAGDKCAEGSQLRPHIVWFGEMVPEMDIATDISAEADIFLIIGTSLNVYPAAGLVHSTRKDCPIYLVDPNEVNNPGISNLVFIKETAGLGVPALVEKLLAAEF